MALVAEPLVAIVVSVYNKASYVGETLRSALAQTYPATELIVVDDGSTDDSLRVTRAALQATEARLVAVANGGVSAARNLGYQHVSPDAAYVLFLDADDVLEPDAIGRLVRHLAQHPAAVACYCDVLFVDENGAPLAEPPDQCRWVRTAIGRRRLGSSEHVTPLDAVWSRFWALPSTLLIRRRAFEQIAGWDSNLCRPARPFHAEDKDLAIQLALLGELHHIDDRLVKYRVLPSGHKDAVYQGLRALDAKWSAAPLPGAQRARVRRALWFDARVRLLDTAAALATHQQGGRFVDHVRDLARSSARYATTGWRLRRAAKRSTRPV